MYIINIDDLKSFRKFTLNKGHDRVNTMFVRVADGYAVGADPMQFKNEAWDAQNPDWATEFRYHHVKNQGYKYICRKGYTLATQKQGKHGWTALIKSADNTYKCFNPFEGRVLSISLVNGVMLINDGKNKAEVEIGVYGTVLGEMPVIATPFTGMRSFLRLIRSAPEWATLEVNNVSYNEKLTRKYDRGVVTKGNFDILESFALSEVEYCSIEKENYLVKMQGRIFVTHVETYGAMLLSDMGIPNLFQSFNTYKRAEAPPSNFNYETTEKWWKQCTTGKPIIKGKVRLADAPFEKRELIPLEAKILNSIQNTYAVFGHMSICLGLNDIAGDSMYDEFRYAGRDTHENVKAILYALDRIATLGTKKAQAQMLCNLLHMPFEVNCNENHCEFEKKCLLGTFLTACIRREKDMPTLWASALKTKPESVTDWLNANLLYYVEIRSVGYHFNNNPAWAEKRNYNGEVKYIFAENASCAKYELQELTQSEFEARLVVLAEERAYKVRYDNVPKDIANKHFHLSQQDNRRL